MSFWGSVLDLAAKVFPSIVETVGGAYKNDENYGNTKEGFQENMAYQRELMEQSRQLKEMELANALQIAAMQAGSSGASAAASRANAILGAKTQAYDIGSRERANLLAQKIEAIKGRPDLHLVAGQRILEALSQEGTLAQNGYQHAAEILSRFKKRDSFEV